VRIEVYQSKVMSLMSSFSSFDIFAKGVGFNIGGNETFKTRTGAGISILYLATVMLVTYQQFSEFFDTTSPQTILEGYHTSNYPKVDLTKYNLMGFFVGSLKQTEYIPVQALNRYVTLRAYKQSWLSWYAFGDDSVTKQNKFYPVVPCKSLDVEDREIFSYVKEGTRFYNIFQEFGMCPKISKNSTIEGKGIDNFMEEFIFEVLPCTLSGEGACASQEELEKFSFNLVFPASNFNASNYEYPHSQIPNADSTYFIVPGLRQLMSVYFIENHVYNYIGALSAWSRYAVYYDMDNPLISSNYRSPTQIQCKFEETVRSSDSGCYSYFTLNLMSSGQVVVRKRQFPTLLDTLGTVGGITGVVSMVLGFLYEQINRRKRNRFIIKNVYPMMAAENLMSASRLVRRRFPLCCLHKRVNLLNQNSEKDIPGLGISHQTAMKRVESSLDIVNIVRDSCYLRIIAEVLLKERHRGLSQILDVKLWKAENEREAYEKMKSTKSIGGQKIVRDNQLRHRSSTYFVKYTEVLRNRSKWLGEVEFNINHKNTALELQSDRNNIEFLFSQAMDGLYHDQLTNWENTDGLQSNKLVVVPSKTEQEIGNLTPAKEEINEHNCDSETGNGRLLATPVVNTHLSDFISTKNILQSRITHTKVETNKQNIPKPVGDMSFTST